LILCLLDATFSLAMCNKEMGEDIFTKFVEFVGHGFEKLGSAQILMWWRGEFFNRPHATHAGGKTVSSRPAQFHFVC